MGSHRIETVDKFDLIGADGLNARVKKIQKIVTLRGLDGVLVLSDIREIEVQQYERAFAELRERVGRAPHDPPDPDG